MKNVENDKRAYLKSMIIEGAYQCFKPS